MSELTHTFFLKFNLPQAARQYLLANPTASPSADNSDSPEGPEVRRTTLQSISCLHCLSVSFQLFLKGIVALSMRQKGHWMPWRCPLHRMVTFQCIAARQVRCRINAPPSPLGATIPNEYCGFPGVAIHGRTVGGRWCSRCKGNSFAPPYILSYVEVVSLYGHYLRHTSYFISSPRAVPLEYPSPIKVKVEHQPEPKWPTPPPYFGVWGVQICWNFPILRIFSSNLLPPAGT